MDTNERLLLFIVSLWCLCLCVRETESEAAATLTGCPGSSYPPKNVGFSFTFPVTVWQHCFYEKVWVNRIYILKHELTKLRCTYLRLPKLILSKSFRSRGDKFSGHSVHAFSSVHSNVFFVLETTRSAHRGW